MSIAELLIIVTLFSILLPAAAMVREKERGTIEQLLVSPLSAFQDMFSKVLAMTLVIVLFTSISLFLVIGGVFNVPFKGSPWLFLALSTLYVFSTSGLGLLIATFSRYMAQAGVLITPLIAPMIFLSGAWMPPEAMPTVMRWLMMLSPLHYSIDAGYGALLKGATLYDGSADTGNVCAGRAQLRGRVVAVSASVCVALQGGQWICRKY